MKIECHLGHTCTLHQHTAKLLLKTSDSLHYICTNYSDKLHKTSLQSVETGKKSVGFIAAAVLSHKLHVNENANGRKVSIMQLTRWWNFSRAPVLVLLLCILHVISDSELDFKTVRKNEMWVMQSKWWGCEDVWRAMNQRIHTNNGDRRIHCVEATRSAYFHIFTVEYENRRENYDSHSLHALPGIVSALPYDFVWCYWSSRIKRSYKKSESNDFRAM